MTLTGAKQRAGTGQGIMMMLACCEEILKEKGGLCQRPQCLLACYEEILEEKKGSLSAT
jgi:hypothetical protein